MKGQRLRRRAFVTLLGGAAAAWPLAARAQQRERMRRIAMLMNLASDDTEGQARNAAFLQGLGGLGWIVGRNVRIEYRWAAGDADRYRRYAVELVGLAPDILVGSGAAATIALQLVTRTIPIVFANAADPVGGGLVTSLARPGDNTTGFASYEFSMAAKWLELLKQVAPRVTRVAVLRDPTNIAGSAQFGAIQAVAPPLGVDLTPADARNAGAIERGITEFARGPNDGLIVTSLASAIARRDLIITLAARHRLPAIYPLRNFVADGGLVSYGPDTSNVFRLAAGYVDRILKGEKPADLPVQNPTKYQTVLNLKTAKALGLDVPATVLVRADEVIE